jgi:hypothetical protein
MEHATLTAREKYLLETIRISVLTGLGSSIRDGDSVDFVDRTQKRHREIADQLETNILIALADIKEAN